MNVAGDLLPPVVAGALWLAFLGLVARVAARAPWGLLRANGLEAVFAGAVAAVAVLWSMSVGARPGLELHMLGATALTLIFGWRMALLAATLALVAVTVLGVYDGAAFGLHGLLLAALPVGLSHALGREVYRRLPHHFVIYVFAVAFFGSMAVIAAVVAVSAAALYLLGAYPPSVLWDDYLVMLPLIMFPEGFVTGMILTMLVVYRPEWVRTFDDRDYLDER